MNPLKKLAGQTAIYGLPTIVGRFLNYLLVPLFTYNISQVEYGVVNEMYAYVSLLIIVLTGGMETALFHFSVKEDHDKNKVFSTALLWVIATSLLVMLPVLMFSDAIGEILQPGDPEPIPYDLYAIYVILIIALDAITAIPFARLREQNRAKRFAVIKTINIAINIFFNLFFIWFCLDIYRRQEGALLGFVNVVYDPEIGVAGYIFISNLVASGVTLLLLLPEMLKIKWTFEAALWRRMMVYSLPLVFAGLAGMVNETMDRILLKYLLPEDVALQQVGIYGACYKIAVLMTIFIQTFRYAAEPFFFSQSKKEDARSLYATVMKFFVIACSLIFLGTMVNLPWIQNFIGPDFRSGLEVVPILLIANLCLGVFFNLSIWYKLTGHTRYGAYLTFFGSVITLALNFYWIPRIGYMGSAWATLICYASMMIVSYIIGQKYYPVNYDLKRILGYLALSLILFFLNNYIVTGSEVMEVVTGNIFLLLFALVVYLLEKPRKAIIS